MAIGYRCEGCSIIRAERWRGPCPGCYGFFNIRRTVSSEGTEEGPPPRGQILSLNAVTASSLERISVGFPGIDRILGTDPITGEQGIAAKGGQAVQIYGAPGSGKSTLLLQMAQRLTKQRYTVFYVVGEESMQQVKARADRVGKFNDKMIALEEQDLDSILYQMEEVAPDIVIIDSINALSVEDYAAGSVPGMRIAAREIYKYTQTNGIGLFLVVQVDKSGTEFSGPKELEHIIDTSLFLDNKRRLRCDSKNRFGLTPASQLLQMKENGLVEIDDPPVAEETPES